METKKFLMTSSYYPPYHIGGDATHVKCLSEELVKLGHEVHVMFSIDAFRYKRPEFNVSFKEIEESNGVILHPLQSPLGKIEPYLAYLTGNSQYVNSKFKDLLNSINPDVVHHHNIFFLGYDILRKQGDYINLYTAHDYWLTCQRFDLMKFGHNSCDRRNCFSCALHAKRIPQIWRHGEDFKIAIKQIDTIIAPSSFVKRKLSEHLSSNVKHIPYFSSSPSLNIKNSKYTNYFLYVGVLERHKGICNLLKVFKEYEKRIDTKLIIVGTGSLKNKIQEYILTNKLEDKIKVLGWLDGENLTALYKDALALILPSIWSEVFGLVIIESMSVGTPSIGANSGGIPEIINMIDKKLIFDPNNIEQLSDILINYNKTSYKTSIVKNIYESFYSVETYMKTYNTIIGNEELK